MSFSKTASSVELITWIISRLMSCWSSIQWVLSNVVGTVLTCRCRPIGECLFRISTGTATILTEEFHSFPQYLQVYTRSVPSKKWRLISLQFFSNSLNIFLSYESKLSDFCRWYSVDNSLAFYLRPQNFCMELRNEFQATYLKFVAGNDLPDPLPSKGNIYIFMWSLLIVFNVINVTH